MTWRLLAIYAGIVLIVLLRIILVKPIESLPTGAKIIAIVRLISSPQARAGHDELKVLIRGNQVRVIVPQYSEYHYGDLLRISGTLKSQVIDSKKTVYSIYFPKITYATDGTGFLFRAAGFVRSRVGTAFNLYLPPDESALLQGIVLGVSTTLSKDIKQDLQKTGVTHVVAASGMNVTLLAGFLLPVFLRFYKRRQAIVLTIFCLFFYTIISGASASIVRATLMASIGYLGFIAGRQRTAVISFFLTACLMTLWNPRVISDIGFQLSFAATAGMLLISPIIPSLARLPILSLVEDDLKTTISAQVATLPILLIYFHGFGLFSVAVNALVLWTIPALMVIGSVATVVALFSLQLGGILAFISLPFLSYFLGLVKLFAAHSPEISILDLPIWIVVGYYTIVSSILWLGFRHTDKNTTKL